jgi:hypothetical protein
LLQFNVEVLIFESGTVCFRFFILWMLSFQTFSKPHMALVVARTFNNSAIKVSCVTVRNFAHHYEPDTFQKL